MISRWRNAPGSLSVSIGKDSDGLWVEADDWRALPDGLAAYFDANYPCIDSESGHVVELLIEIESDGYSDPGRGYESNGDPGYPPEGEDERRVVSVMLDENPPPALPASLHDEVYGMWEKSIHAAEVDHNDYSGSDV